MKKINITKYKGNTCEDLIEWIHEDVLFRW
jgi:hypothetical protein